MAAALSYLTVVLLAGFAGGYIAYNLLPSREEIQAMGPAREVPSGAEIPVILRFFRLPMTMLRPLVGNWGSSRYRDRKLEQIGRSGLSEIVGIDEVVSLKFCLAAALGGLMALYQLPIVFLLAAGLFGFFFPDLWLLDRARYRGARIVRDLPFGIDLMALLVQAGLDFTAAVARTASKLNPGPLREELERMLKEFRLGASRVEALQHLSERARVREMTTLCTALIQASELGSSIGPTLRQQSEMMRTQRFQDAERKGGVASQQMVIPLVLFIMPAVFVMILGPALIRYIYGG